MSVYRDMLKQAGPQSTPEGEAAHPLVSEIPTFLRSAVLTRMMPDLESLSSQLANLTDRVRIITFCGVDEGVGVSHVALGVAQQLAEVHPGEVIFLDMNSRSRRASLIESYAPADSFYKYLESETDTGISQAGPLHLLSARVGRQALGRLKSKDILAGLSRLKEVYRWVLIDAPPANHPESLIWAGASSGTILIVESNRTRRLAAQAVTEQLNALHVNLLGTVLNRRRLVIPEWLYRWLFK